jgi:hypothetical protein
MKHWRCEGIPFKVVFSSLDLSALDVSADELANLKQSSLK